MCCQPQIYRKMIQLYKICCCSVTQPCLALCHPWTAACQASLSFTISRSLLNSCPSMPSKCLCHPVLLPPSIFPRIKVCSNEAALHIRWPEYWSSASASVLPVNVQVRFPLGLTGWISFQSKECSPCMQIYILFSFFTFSSIIGCYNIFCVQFPVLNSRSLLVIYFIYRSEYILNPNL